MQEAITEESKIIRKKTCGKLSKKASNHIEETVSDTITNKPPINKYFPILFNIKII